MDAVSVDNEMRVGKKKKEKSSTKRKRKNRDKNLVQRQNSKEVDIEKRSSKLLFNEHSVFTSILNYAIMSFFFCFSFLFLFFFQSILIFSFIPFSSDGVEENCCSGGQEIEDFKDHLESDVGATIKPCN